MSMFRNIVMTRTTGGYVGTNTKYGATVDTFLGDVDSNGVLQVPTAQTDLVFDGVTDLANYALYYKFFRSAGIRSASFPQLIQISGTNALNNCFCGTSIENISFPVLQSVTGGNAFAYAFNDTPVQAVSFPKLRKIGSDTATGMDFGHFNYAFSGTKVTSLEFPELTAIYCTGSSSTFGTFYNNNTIQKMYFPKLTVIDKSPAYTSSFSISQKNIFYNCSKLTEIHFGAANRAAIEATEGYSTLWGRGAGKATVYFDL